MAMTIEIPDVLRAKVDAYVDRRRAEYSRYSVKDAMLEGLRQLVDQSEQKRVWLEKDLDFSAGKIQVGMPDGRMTAAQLAAGIPGLQLGVGGITNVGDCPTEEVVSLWREPLSKVRVVYQSDPSAGAEDFNTLLSGNLPPSKFAQWATQPRVFEELVTYLDEKRPAGPGGW